MRKEGAILKSSRFYRALSTPAALLLTLLFLAPLAIILSKAFIADEGGVTLARLAQVFSDPHTYRILGFTLMQALVSTLVSILIALPGAYLLANYKFRGKGVIKALTTIPFILPSILVVLGFVIFYGSSGIINTLLGKAGLGQLKVLYTFGAIIMAHAFYNFPIALGLIASYWEGLSPVYTQVSATLGAKRGKSFRSITLPRLMPAILSASTFIFLFCFASFVILLVLGGGPRFTTLEVEIYRRAKMSLDLGGAAALSLLSIAVALIFVTLHLNFQRRLGHQEEATKMVPHRSPSFIKKLFILLYSILALIFVLGPLASIVYRSFRAPLTRSGDLVFSLKWYRELFSYSLALRSLITSLLIAAVVTLVTLFVATPLAARLRYRGRTMELYAMLPMAVSSVIIGFGYYLISTLFKRGPTLSFVSVILAHVVIASPFVLRTLLPEYRKIDFSYTEVSLTLGATVGQTFRKIELPLLRGAIATAGAFAFAISIGEFNATLILGDLTTTTVPIVMSRLINAYNFAGACALGSILMLL
ncbi:MAG: iron ABC transporter permease [Spirochaetales bacterium]|nr:iron ABC transporter permease [Spirochaetales bacterium]